MSHYPDEMQPLLLHLQKQDLSAHFITEIADAIYNEIKAKKSDFMLDEQRAIAKQLIRKKFEYLLLVVLLSIKSLSTFLDLQVLVKRLR